MYSLANRAICLLLLMAGIASSQSYTAAIRGVITDSSGAAIPSAQVIVTEAERNVKHTATTDAAGRYFLSALPPGQYTLGVEAQGFKRHAQSAFTLTVAQQATLDVQLEVGAVSSTVEVSASAPLLNTTISSLGQTIENKYIVTLPNIGRDTLNLAYLTPGVVGAAGRPGDTSTNFVANGGRNSTADVLVDGATVVTVEQNSGITDLKYKPSVDAVQEFKMQTNFFPAEYGQTGGAAIQIVTKSGSNQFHGTGFYFLRHSDFNANNWFSNRSGATIPYFRRDQWGGVVGGPIIKNKTFFFATYENTKQKSPTTETQTVPTLLQRDGDFSQTLNSSGQMITIYNPFDTFTNASGAVERRPFAGNVVPKSMMNPIALKMLSYFPLPNTPASSITGTNNWFAQGVNASPSQKMDFKGDHNFTDKDRLTGRYSFGRSDGVPANLFGEGNPAYTFNNGPNGTRTTSIVSDYTRVHSATSIFTVRYGLIYSTYYRNPMVTGFDLTTLGLPQYMKDNATHAVFPTIAPEGYLDIGTEGYVVMDRQEGTHQFSGSYTKTLNAHNIKAGGELRNNFLDYAQPGYPSGRFAFGSQTTRKLLTGGSANLEGNGLASMLLGFGNGSDYHIDPKAYSRSRYMGFYVQDDWKVTRNLTLNLGLRYELDIPRWELQNRYSYWDTEAKSPIQVPGYDLRGVMKFVDDNTRSPFNTDYNNFSPRVGFAWAVNDKTSIRSGGAILYSLSRATVTGHTGAAFSTNSQVPWTLDSSATQYATLSNPYPQGLLIPPGSSGGDSTFLGLGAGTISRDNMNPEMYSWNFSIQRELPFQSVLEVNYTGSRGVHLLIANTSLSNLDPQYWSLGRTALQAQVPNPFYGIITDPKAVNLNGPTVQRYRLLRGMPQYDGASRAERTAGDSNYHALQVKWEKRYSNGVNFLTHYTWSKMIDNASASAGNLTWLGGTTSMQNPLDYDMERSLSAHDIPHRLVATGSWALPFGTGRKFASNSNRLMDAFIGGWEISSVLTLQSGVPLQVSQSGGTLWNGTQRPHLVGDPSTEGRVQDRLNQYFNPAAFVQPAQDVFGTAPRYLGYRGPGVRTMDAALLKSWRVKEGQTLQFRIEAQNATNTPIFNDPNGSFGSSSFGQITSTRIGPRNVQLGFKYLF